VSRGLADSFSLNDGASQVRGGEELDLDALAPYLRRHLPAAGLEVADDAELTVEQFPSGWSNLTYLLRLGRHELVLRRPPFGNVVKSAHDMAREHRVLSALAPVWGPAPQPYLLCSDESVIGAEFYVMERVRGVILRRELPAGLELPPERARGLSAALIDGMADLHGIDYAAAGLGDLGRPEGYARRQVEGWSKRYFRAKTDEHQELEAVAAWLAGNVPTEGSSGVGPALVHNDYKYDNVVWSPEALTGPRGDPGEAASSDATQLRAVLDWEMATVGDPMMDLGTTLGYWVDPGDPAPMHLFAMGPTAVAGSLSRRELAARYAEATGADLTHLPFYYGFGLFKIAVIIQQIYARYVAGKTQDPRFAELDQAVGLFGKVAAGVLEGSC